MSKVEKKQLFNDGSSDEDDDSNIKINKSYAQRYDEWREAEIKRKLEDRYGNLDEQLSSSSSDDEDDPQELEKALSKDFFEVISQLRKKDPKIYNPEVRFFGAEEQPSTSEDKKKKKDKPIYLRDYERKLIVERGGVLSDSESDTEGQKRPASPSLAEKENALKESLARIVHSDSDDDDSALLTKKVKTAEEKKKEEDDYIEWLRGRKEELKDKSLQESLSHLKEEWSNPNLDEGEKFLRDYILNKRYLGADNDDADTGNLTDEEYQDEYMDEFERKYNFRFEEPDSDFLKRYPRTIESSVRKKDDRRKRHREEVKKRKEEEKVRQREELKVLKSLKRKEIMKRIDKIKEITGNAELGITDKDLEADYDPEEHDKRMNELFNNDYYQEGDDEVNLEDLPLPPLEEDLIDDYENWDEYEGGEGENQMDEELHCEDPDFNMDCDYDPQAFRLAKEAQPKSSRERRKLKRQSRFGTLVRKKKPEFDPNEKTFQQYLDEYYGIDYEDIVGGQPCRFKYRKVLPNSFGLTIEEILAADDKELNAWVSIKKATALRPDHVELNEKRMYELKAQNEALKRKILPSLYKHETEINKKKSYVGNALKSDENAQNQTENEASPVYSKKKKTDEETELTTYVDDAVRIESSKKKKKKRGQNKPAETEVDVREINVDTQKEESKLNAVQSEELSTKKKKRGQNKPTETEVDVREINVDTQTEESKLNAVQSEELSTKKKKRGQNKPAETEVDVREINVDTQTEESKLNAVQSEELSTKKKKRGQNKPTETEVDVREINVDTQTEESKLNEVHSEKLSTKKKKQKRLLSEPTSDHAERLCENIDNSKKVGKKRPAEAMNESTNKTSPFVNSKGIHNSGSKTKEQGSKNPPHQSKRRKLDNGTLEISPRKNFTQSGDQPTSAIINKNKKNFKNKDDKNRVLQCPPASSRKSRMRRGKDRKKLLLRQKNASGAPRDVKAENKARAMRKQTNKPAPVLENMSDSRLKAYGLNPKKFKNKLMYT